MSITETIPSVSIYSGVVPDKATQTNLAKVFLSGT